MNKKRERKLKYMKDLLINLLGKEPSRELLIACHTTSIASVKHSLKEQKYLQQYSKLQTYLSRNANGQIQKIVLYNQDGQKITIEDFAEVDILLDDLRAFLEELPKIELTEKNTELKTLTAYRKSSAKRLFKIIAHEYPELNADNIYWIIAHVFYEKKVYRDLNPANPGSFREKELLLDNIRNWVKR